MRSSRAEWVKRVERWKGSDLTAAEFAAETGVNARTLVYWKWRLTKDAREGTTPEARPKRTRKRAPAPAAKSTFVEVTPSAGFGWPAAERIEVVVDQRLVVRVPDAFEPRTLRLVLSAISTEGE